MPKLSILKAQWAAAGAITAAAMAQRERRRTPDFAAVRYDMNHARHRAQLFDSNASK